MKIPCLKKDYIFTFLQKCKFVRYSHFFYTYKSLAFTMGCVKNIWMIGEQVGRCYREPGVVKGQFSLRMR